MKKTFLGVILIGSILPGILQAELTVASLFKDHAVLQRDQEIPVWGTGDPGTKVTIEFDGQKKSAKVDSFNKWKVMLDPVGASFEPRELTVSSPGNSTIRLSNILVGEVWICSGQSNMQFPVSSVPEIKALVPTIKNLRTFEVKKTVAFTEQNSCAGEWVDAHPNSAVACSFAYFLEKTANVPVGIILTCWGSSSIEAWMPRDMTESVPHFKTMMQEFDADTETRERIQSILDGSKPWPREDDIFLRRQSNIVYNAMMHPLAPYACRGLVWYQGERNTQSMYGMLETPWYSRNSGMLKYADTLQEWIKRYRKEWQRDDFHFLVVMLPGCFNKSPATGPQLGADHPAVHSWAWMRESQLSALELPGTSVANTIDLGDLKNVHPKDKLPVGQRLALLAARDTLGMDMEASGPAMKTVKRKGSKMIVEFDHADGLKTTDGAAPSAFWIADNSREWKKADAELDGQTVVLRSASLNKPLYVRYAFAGKPEVNLVNRAELPAYPFRTDTFKP